MSGYRDVFVAYVGSAMEQYRLACRALMYYDRKGCKPCAHFLARTGHLPEICINRSYQDCRS